MNGKRVRAIKQAFKNKHGRVPNKAIVNEDGSLNVSEWRQVKKHFVRTGEIL